MHPTSVPVSEVHTSEQTAKSDVQLADLVLALQTASSGYYIGIDVCVSALAAHAKSQQHHKHQ